MSGTFTVTSVGRAFPTAPELINSFPVVALFRQKVSSGARILGFGSGNCVASCLVDLMISGDPRIRDEVGTSSLKSEVDDLVERFRKKTAFLSSVFEKVAACRSIPHSNNRNMASKRKQR
jgi:hypothetical protein